MTAPIAADGPRSRSKLSEGADEVHKRMGNR